MNKDEIKNLIKELIEKTDVIVSKISTTEDAFNNTYFQVELSEPYFYINRNGEGLLALNHIIRKMVEVRNISNLKTKNSTELNTERPNTQYNILVDINSFQQKRIEGIRAIAHMMAERARYFKSNIEIDPMTSFERKIIHEFLSDATDLKTESTGFGASRRIVIKYLDSI